MAKVTGEVYRVLGVDFATPKAAAIYAMQQCIEQNLSSAVIQRVTLHDDTNKKGEFSDFFEPKTETVTGEVVVDGPARYNTHPSLSRYSAVNGWVIPGEI